MRPRCVAEPISWLRLELYEARMLDAAERARVVDHLVICAACSACLASLRGDGRTLPPLYLPAEGGGAGRRARRTRARWRGGWIAGASGLAAAGALVFALRTAVDSAGITSAMAPRSGAERRLALAKGGALAFSLVREDGERIDGNAGAYRDGERFKAIVTCAPGAEAFFDLVVFDDGGPSYPLEAASGLACGNDVALPGAFRLKGRAEEQVCLLWSTGGPVDRALTAPGGGSEERACKRLSPR